VLFHPGRIGLPLPRTFVTEFYCEADYKIAVGTASATSGAVKLNAPWLPFRPGGSSAFPSFTFLGPATEATLLPTGYSTVANSLMYQQYKVLRSTIAIKWNGSNSGNNVTMCVVPAVNTTSFTGVYTSRTSPYARQSTFSVSKPNVGVARDGWFRYTVDPEVIIGATRVEGKADMFVNAAYYNNDPTLTLFWFVWLQSNDLDVTTTTASLFQVRMHYQVQLFQMGQMTTI